MLKHSLIVSTYNRPNALDLVLNSIYHQSVQVDEVIIADDGSSSETKLVIDLWKKNFKSLIHVWHEDQGFRLAEIRNKGISISSGDFISCIDGDMVLHQNFVRDVQMHIEPNIYLQGKRVLVGDQSTKLFLSNEMKSVSFFSPDIINRFNTISNPLLSKYFSRYYQSIKAVKGCSMHFWRKDAIRINGFNQDIKGWGREDSEFLCRLLNSGIKRKNIVLGAVAYHLYHKEAPRNQLDNNDTILDHCIKEKTVWCKNGIELN
jgi:glycosyltransferase involved in cell wall biosynthesis